jgi:hypothetical protein
MRDGKTRMNSWSECMNHGCMNKRFLVMAGGGRKRPAIE